jgi:aspartate/glutamate racemase
MESVDVKSENVYSQRVRAGKRTYFFDVKATRSTEDYYIIITESRRMGEEKYEKHKIFLYKEDFQKFMDALKETITHVENELLIKSGKETGQ